MNDRSAVEYAQFTLMDAEGYGDTELHIVIPSQIRSIHSKHLTVIKERQKLIVVIPSQIRSIHSINNIMKKEENCILVVIPSQIRSIHSRYNDLLVVVNKGRNPFSNQVNSLVRSKTEQEKLLQVVIPSQIRSIHSMPISIKSRLYEDRS